MINQDMLALGSNRSVIRELFEYGKSRIPVVGADKVYDYSLGNPCIPSPVQVNEAIQQILQDTPSLQVHGYTSATGDLEARKAIAQDLQDRFGGEISPENLFLCAGAAPALICALRALAVPQGEVVAIAPYFPEYKPFVQSTGLAFRVAEADIPDFQINFDQLEQVICENTVAMIVNSPNNPSGAIYTEATLRRLAQLLTEKSKQYGHPIYIIADEPYRELVYDGAQVPFIPNIYPNTVVCYSYSKSLSLPGERIGYVYVPSCAQDSQELYAAVAGAARICGHVCAPSLMQKVIARCAHLRPDLKSYDENRRALYEGLVAAGYKVCKPQGAFYLFVEAPGGDAMAFCKKAMEKDLLIVPGNDFGCAGYFRLCYCVHPDTIRNSLPIFKELIGE